LINFNELQLSQSFVYHWLLRTKNTEKSNRQ